MLLKRMLEKKFRMEVFEAEDGLQGLETYRRTNPKMIFLDVAMPNMNGIEFLEAIRQEDPNIPVIVLTCYCEKETVDKMLRLGITDYIVKAEYITRLSERIESILESNGLLVI